MSDVLVRQLQQVLEPWNALEGDSDDAAHRKGGASEPWGCASAPESLARARAATTKLELARAALALFTSNAGAFRPALLKVFRFLFDHIDELRDDVAQLKMEQMVWQQGESVRAAGGGPSSSLSGGTPDEQNAVVSAYEKVRMTESRMAALVEEASVQRDHFKSQIEAQKKQQYHLEDLLQHQMELTQTLMDHRLRQELVGGSPAGPNAATGGGSAAGEGAGGGNTAAVRGDVAAATEAAQGGGGGGRRAAERRDAAYVHRLITRADRELTLERTEDQLRDLRVHQDELEKKVQSLLKLNTKYARQCVELSARLSIVHENNIALAADVQLFQRDCVKEQQRSQSLLHAMLVARGIVLTTLQVQPGFHAEDMLDEVDAIDRASANPQWRRYDTDAGLQGSRVPAVTSSPTQKVIADTPFSASAPTAGDELTNLTLDPADEVEEALRVLPSTDLQRQVRELLQLDDVDHGGKVKVALLHFLELEAERRAQQQQGGQIVSAGETQKWLSLPSTHRWVPPYGLRSSVPRHLRCITAVPLLVLHPVLAEAFVHELTTQRYRLLAFSQVQLEEARRAAAAPLAEQMVGGATLGELQQISASATASSLVSFANFIELFVLVVWLNRADRYLPLLPTAERVRLEAEALVREDAHARRVSRLVAATSSSRGKLTRAADANSGGKTSCFQTTLWELRHVLHLVRPSNEASSLPPEGLQLTYALDAASQQTTAGPLTYAYGLTSRGVVCEVLFCVLRAERDALLSLCRAVDAAMVAHAESQRVARVGQQQDGASASPDNVKRVNGWVPTVQLIRALLVLYPGYPLRRVEQLIDAAVAEGTAGAENPATLYYEVLLPGRSLPGPTTATTAADTSLVRSTRFASLFYTAVCDDAVASMQIVEDSVAGFMKGSTEGMVEGGGAASVTGRQITANAFLGLPRLESQQWVAGLRSAIHRWPRLRSTIADPGKASATSSSTAATATTAAREAEGDEAEADRVSTVAQVPTTEVMPYLRQNVIVRRGLFAHAEAGVLDGAAGSLTGPLPAAVPTHTGASSKAAAGTAAAVAASESGGSLVADGWTPAQARLLQHWETQWTQYSSNMAAVPGATPALFCGPTTVADYVELLRHLDPYRTRPWGSALVCDGSAVLHPLNYAEGWPEEALGIVHASAVASVPEAALKSAMAKVGKKNARKPAGPPR